MYTKLSRAFTLIELLVVLFVLAAIAGIAIPVVTSVTAQSHGATGAASIANLDSSFRTAQASKGRVGAAGFDSLIDSSNNVIGYLMYPGDGLVVCDLASPDASSPIPDAATAQRVANALVNAGITSVRLMNDDATTGDATFVNTAADVPITTAPSGTVLAIDHATFQTDLPLDPSKLYVVFGLGDDSALQGKVVAESPTFIPVSASAREKYSNFVVVYQIPTGTNPTAQYASAGMPMKAGVLGINHHLKVYHQARDDQ